MKNIRICDFFKFKEFFDKPKRVSYLQLVLLAIFAFIVIDHAVLVVHNPCVPFIGTDPSAPFLTSAIYILEWQRPFVYTQPGSAYYILLALGLIPFKLYSLINKINFVDFVYLHKEVILTYLQFFTLLFSLTGLYLLSRAVVNLTKKEWTGFFAVLLFLSLDGNHYKSLWLVSAEGYLIFISGVTLFLFSKYALNKQEVKYLYLSFLSLGLGLAGKTSMFVLAIFLFSFVFYELQGIRDSSALKIKQIAKFIGTTMLGFIMGTVVLGNRLMDYFAFIYASGIHSGQYESGRMGISLARYCNNIVNLFNTKGFFIALFIFTQILLFKSAKSKKISLAAKQLINIGMCALLASGVYLPICNIEALNERYVIVVLLLLSFSFSAEIQILLKNKRALIMLCVIIAAFGAFLQWMSIYKGTLWYIRVNNDMDRLIDRHNIDLRNDTVIFDCHVLIKNKNIYFLYANDHSFGMYNNVLYRYQPTILLYYMDSKRLARYDKKSYEGKWNYAIIGKEITKRYNTLNLLNAKIIDEEGNYYLMTPALAFSPIHEEMSMRKE
jgi:energy-converting hydrogenase Eha subunit C